MRRPAVPRSLPALLLALTLAGPLAAQDAGPVTKPMPSPAGGNRLPAPTGLTVRQDAQGAIVFSWAPVEGAVRYNIGRSVGTEGFRQATPPTTQGTSLVDTRVTQGIRHVYTVTPIDAQGIAGVRATSEVFIPSRPYAAPTAADAAPVAPSGVVAQYFPSGVLHVTWTTAPTGVRYDVYQRIGGQRGALLGSVPRQHNMWAGSPVPAGTYAVEVIAYDAQNRMSTPGVSGTVVVPPRVDSTTTTTGTGASGIAAEDAGGTVLVNVATPVTLRVGATHSLARVAGSGWTSLSPSIASVSADGTVTARAAGVAQLATVGADASGAVRVTVVRVRVTP
jgi:hypothetical protein